MKFALYSIILTCVLILSSCGHSSDKKIKVAASSIPHAEILEFIRPDLTEQNIELEIVVIDDFNLPNRALAEKEVDANFFQHLPFLESQIADFGYPLESLVAMHVEPMALYSKKYQTLHSIKDGSTIAIPNDVSNQARALLLLEKYGWITLKSQGAKVGLIDIVSNPHGLKFIEMDSPLLSRALDDVDAAIISTNFALLGGLSPQKDALAIETGQSPFANIVVIRIGEDQRPELQALKDALTSDKVDQFIEEHYQGAVIPTRSSG